METYKYKEKIITTKYKYEEKVINVHCKKCHRFIDEKLTTFVDIEEDIQGADVMTFICPYCRIEQKSRRFG